MDTLTLVCSIIGTFLLLGFCYVIVRGAIMIKEHQKVYNSWWMEQPEYEQERQILLTALPERAVSLQREKSIYSTQTQVLERSEKLILREPPMHYAPPVEEDEHFFMHMIEEEELEEAEPLDMSDSEESFDGLYESDPTAYYDFVAHLWVKAVQHCERLKEEYDIVKIIRDTNRSGYPGFVAARSASEEEKEEKISREEWDEFFKKGGIFWEARVLTYDSDGNVVLDENDRENLQNWFRDVKGYTIKDIHMEDYDEEEE